MDVFRRYFLPGFVFQSVVIAGGYGTGRELAEFFLPYGPRGGLLAMVAVTMVVWSAVSAVTFELARQWRTYDYRAFFRRLLGRGWILFEAAYLGLLLIVLAVIAAAAGSILQETFGLPYWIGVLGMMLTIGLLVFAGSSAIEGFFAGWSFVLYATFVTFFGWSLLRFGPQIREGLAAPVGEGRVTGGLAYAAYNLALVPAILFSVRHVETRREAWGAGLLAGPIAIVPGFLFVLAMAGHYPEVATRTVPANYLLEGLGSRGFQIVFQIVLFGTLVETGTGMIHAVNERIAGALRERSAAHTWWRPVVAWALLGFGAFTASFGLIALIARGYGTITWAVMAVYVVPVLTWGVWRMGRGEAREPAA